MTKEQILELKDIEAKIAELKAKAEVIKDEIKAEMLKEQKETIRLIKECETRANEELQIAEAVLENIKTKL